MRTDSPNLSALSQSNCKQFLLDEYGEKYSTPRNFSSKASNSQEAHEAIRPCLLYTSPSPRDRTRSRMPSSA